MTRVTTLLLAIIVLLVVLTFLLVRAATPDAALHERTLDAFRMLTLHKAALDRDVLRSRAGLLRNYDPLVQSISGLRRAVQTLQMIDPRHYGDSRNEMGQRIGAMAVAVDAAEASVESFKSSNALLQNSLAYFSHANAAAAGATPDPTDARTDARATLAAAILRLVSDPQERTADEAVAALDRLATMARTMTETDRTLIAHGRIIAETLPKTDAVIDRLLASSIGEMTQALESLYLASHGRAAARAGIFRLLLYGTALLLVAYLVHLYRRLWANARHLRSRLTFEELIAEISTRFVGLPRERLGDAIEHALARLADHIGADRAYVVMRRDDADRAARAFTWASPDLARPAEIPDDLLALAFEFPDRPEEHPECIHVPRVADLPGGPVKGALTARGVHSWLCMKLRHIGGGSAAFCLEAVRRERCWIADDIALLRMAGEIFANALERERAENEKQDLEARLHQAQRMELIGTLAGGIAHDFNNILGAILGYSEMALAGLRRDTRPSRHVEEIRKAGLRAKGVVDQILAFSRRGARGRQPVRLRSLLEEARGLLRASLPATVEIRIGHAADAVVLGDATRLQQVVMNLCTNAAQAMAAHGTIAIALARVEFGREETLSHGRLPAGRYVRLTVTDTGRGMDSATMARIFEPFFTTRSAGTGLGLATVHRIVADHGGALNVRSQPGRGSAFEVYFQEAPPGTADREDQDTIAPEGHGERILLVDDEKPLVLLGEEMLAELGYEPAGYASGAQALAAIRADPQRFDLLITDEIMPDLTGTQLAASVHRLRADLPILLMTGYSGPIAPDRLHVAGIRRVLTKPLLKADLARALAEQLQARHTA